MLKRQPANFPQRGKLSYSSARSPYLPVKLAFMPARRRMASASACLIDTLQLQELQRLWKCLFSDKLICPWPLFSLK
jgi:hypothetical protein